MRRLKRKFELHEPGFNAAVSAALRLREHGFAAGLVGGSVRDLLLGKVPSDFDLVTSASWRSCSRISGRSGRVSGFR